MEFTSDNAVKWFDRYFKTFNESNGNAATVAKMKDFFTADLQFVSYLLNVERPTGREGLLNTMLHPGLREILTPDYYVVDTRRKAVVVQMACHFIEESTGKVSPKKQLSVHYYLAQDVQGDLKIRKILFFSEPGSPGDTNTRELMKKYREKALSQGKK
jgi:hypothetical protein